MPTQTVIIDFQSDFSSLQSGIDTLEQMGKVDKDVADQFRKTNTEITKQGQALTTAANKAQGSNQTYSKLSNTMKDFAKNGIGKLVLSAVDLKNAGINAEQFFKKLDPKDAVSKQTTLRNELRKVKEEMQQAALAGGVLGAEYQKLKVRAGELDDTIRDVNNDIKNAGSDTRGIDNIVGSISALAGGYSAVQGAAALFGEESEDLQRALLKVNAAMALATGIQQISNAVQKEGALARVADTIATGAQVAMQRIYTFVTGQATAATVGFKVALAATGIGAIVLLVLALSMAFKKSNKDMEKATEEIERQNRARESMNKLLDQNLNLELARAETAGKAESELIRIRGKGLLQRRADLLFDNKLLVQQRDALDGTSAAYGKLNNQIAENTEGLKEYDNQIQITGENLKKSISDEAKAAFDKAKELGDKSLAEAKKRRALEFEDYQAGIELKLLASGKGSKEELDLQKSLLRAKLQIDLEGEDVTLNQRKLLIQQFFKDRLELEKTFNKTLIAASLEDQKNRDAAILENLNLNEEEKLSVKIEYLQLTAAQEILSAEGNAAKILAINAKLDADIAAARIASIVKTAADSAAIASVMNEPRRRALEGVANDEKMKADIRINAINQAADIDKEAINQQIIANRKANEVIGADNKALNIEHGKLLNEFVFVSEAAQKKITAITETEGEKRRQADIANIQSALSALSEVNNILGQFQQNSQDRISNEIANKKREVEALLEAGAITEKDAKLRNRRIEDEEKKAKLKAAQQQKALAVFNAFITGAQAIMQAIASAPPPYNVPAIAITAALVAAQIAAIASRPVPKFASGKKGSYKGWGEVGEVGAELIQRADGRMEVATRKSMVYLGSQDKVFTAGETKQMLPFVNKEAISANGKGFEFDYDKMAKAINGKNINGDRPLVNIDKDGITTWTQNGLKRDNYFDTTYTSKM